MKQLDVNLPGAKYTIHIGHGILGEQLRQLVRWRKRELVVVVTNETLASLYPRCIEAVLRDVDVRVETCALPDGENHKTLDTLARIYDMLMEVQANRDTLIVAFGGGVVGDTAGFAAATFMRGLPVVQVPTTLLSQVDSSVGGKTAVNHRLGKNAIGAFKQPQGVVIDLEFLQTLPERELRAGLFELIKHGIIQDVEFFGFLEAHAAEMRPESLAAAPNFWSEAVLRSCAVKARVVEQDETEQDLRAILNFGHSLAHLIETHTRYERYLHGEAVGVGMLYAAYVSREWGHLPQEEFDRIRALLDPLITPVTLPALDAEAFGGLLMHDKKASGGGLRFILLSALGQAFIRPGTTPAELWPLFQQFCAEHGKVLSPELA